MQDVTSVWAEIMPQVKNAVTGVGLWTALNQSKAITYEDGQFVIGIPHESSDLGGHLRMQQTRTLIERYLNDHYNKQVTLRVVDGVTAADWEIIKRKDEEAKRLQMAAIEKAQAEIKARSSWDSVYDQISRINADTPNKSLPQNRARFFERAMDMLLEALKSHPVNDDLAERNFARCIERVAQYSEMPSVMVAHILLQRQKGG